MIRASHQRIIRFIISGGTSSGVNFVLLYLLTQYGHIWYLASSVIALCAAFVVTFVLQKFWTFKNHSRDQMSMQLGLFVLLFLSNIIINTFVVWVLTHYLHVWYLASQVLSTAGIAVMNYFIYRHFIFREVSHSTNP